MDYDDDDYQPRKSAEDLQAQGRIDYGTLSLSSFYSILEGHDWYTNWSDDREVYWRGEGRSESLDKAALANGPAHAWLLAEFAKHSFTGAPWSTPKHPKPAAPVQYSLHHLVDLRADYEQLAFSPMRTPTLESLLEQVRCMGALRAFEMGVIPPLIGGVECFRTAWSSGELEAVEAHKKLSERLRNNK